MRLDKPLADMRQPLERAKHYRRRAKELKVIAREWMDSGTRDNLMSVAERYNHMAERIEKQFQPAEQD